jgi:excisionase family DNA binding protein
MLKADDAVKLLSIPKSTLYELVRSRDLPHIRLGRALRFTRADLSRWVEENSYPRR